MRDTIHVAARMSPEMLAEIDRFAAKCDRNRSEMLRALLDVGISVMQDMEKVGLLRVGLTVRNLHEWMKQGGQMKLPGVVDESKA